MDTSKTIRGLVGASAFAALIAALGNFHSWQELAVWASTSAGAGLLTFGLIEGVDSGVEAGSALHKGLNPNVKYWAAVVLSVAFPVAGNALSVYLGWVPFSYSLVVATITTAYNVSQTAHWEGTSGTHEIQHPPDPTVVQP